MSKFLLSCVMAFAAFGIGPVSVSASTSFPLITSTNIDFELSSTLQFESFQSTYKRQYSSKLEQDERYSIFRSNLLRAADLNIKNGSPAFGVNQFSDLTSEEFAKRYLGSNPPSIAPVARRVVSPADGLHNHHLRNPAADVNSFDWRSKNAVTPVKDQGQCGSCWAFSATETIESGWHLAGKDLIELSPQQIVSCDTTDSGCGGGWPHNAYVYVEGTGIELETTYPYTSGANGDSGVCAFKNKTEVAAKISNYAYATPACSDTVCNNQNENILEENLIAHAPVSICVNAASWQMYTGGGTIVDDAACGDHSYSALDHCVQLTGFNTTADGLTKYWNVRNSWGASWGNDGYIFVKFGQNACGIANEATLVEI